MLIRRTFLHDTGVIWRAFSLVSDAYLTKDANIEIPKAPLDARIPSLCHQNNASTSTDKRLIGQPTPDTHPHLMKSLEITPGISRQEYERRRNNLLSVLANTNAGHKYDKHAVIIAGASTKLMTADIPYPFHQSTELLYFTGFQEPDAVLILESKDALPLPHHNMIMFLRPRNAQRERWDGPSAGVDAAVEFFGANEAFPISSLSSIIQRRYGDNSHCLWHNHMDNDTHSKVQMELSKLFTNKHFKNPARQSLGYHSQILRLIKSPAEIDLIKKSAMIGAKAFARVMLSTRPGLQESVLQTILEYECKLQGAQSLAFPPVVAGGEAANTLHYVNNTQILRNDDLVLMDGGCEFNGYACDITRTWPINGKFSQSQKQLYQIVLRVQLDCIKNCRVGVSLDQLHQRMLWKLGMELQDIGIIEKRIPEVQLKKKASEFCPHHLGHYLGMDTHDTPLIHRGLPLQPGMVITIEPGLYIPKNAKHLPERYLGIGIRIEDDILVTEDGAHVLTDVCPKTVEDIEELLSVAR